MTDTPDPENVVPMADAPAEAPEPAQENTEAAENTGTAAEVEQASTPEEDLGTMKLGDQYDECLLGASICGRYAYSLKSLVQFEVIHRRIGEEEAKNVIGMDIVLLNQKYGTKAPIFIDDSLMPEKPQIAVPGQEAPAAQDQGVTGPPIPAKSPILGPNGR